MSTPAPPWREQRFHVGSPSAGTRTAGERDRDRLLYSPSLRRLQGVTQVIPAVDEGYLQHNRLTHSLKVAQVGRRIAESLLRSPARGQGAAIAARGGLDPDVVEAAGLAHDLGHPPFGHIAEEELQELNGPSTPDSFEGNAQSFRIVTKLAATNPAFLGLDLTRATLNAIVKYPNPWDKDRDKWGYYESERDLFEWARDGCFAPGERSLEADIMDWADDITYAVHDVEDFYRVGLIPLAQLREWADPTLQLILDRTARRLETDRDPSHQITTKAGDMRSAWNESLQTFTMDGYDESAANRAGLNRYSSGLIDNYVTSTTLERSGKLRIPKAIRVQVAVLKELTKWFVVEGPALATQQLGQRRVVRELFVAYADALERGIASPSTDAPRQTAGLFPTSMTATVVDAVQRRVTRPERLRIVTDTVASMTEAQSIAIHRRIMGMDFGAFVHPAVG